MKYPTSLQEQIKFLLENPDYFRGFNEYTEPLEGNIVEHIAKDTPIKRVWKDIHAYFKKVSVDVNYIFTVKYMEKHRIVGGCSEFALLTASIFRKKGYPTAIVDFLKVDSVFDGPQKDRPSMDMHSAVILLRDGKWYLHDPVDGTFTRFLVSKMVRRGFLVGNIYRDPIELGITSRKYKFALLVDNLKHILLLDLQEDLLDQYLLEVYKRYKP